MAPSQYDPESPDEQPVALPSAPLVTLNENTVLQPPLTRRGHGPGLVLFLPPPEILGKQAPGHPTKPLDPEPVQKWAEEGFTVVGITTTQGLDVRSALKNALLALLACKYVDIQDRYGVIVYDPQVLSSVIETISEEQHVVCVVSYGAHPSACALSLLSHIPNSDQGPPNLGANSTCHKYSVSSPYFVHPGATGYHGSSAGIAHTRSLIFLRNHIGGPHFDIEAIWDEHTYFEFAERSVAKTMGTMVAEPYVNHVPTMTGGMGRKALTAFYRDHFIFANPEDTALETISRTVGVDRIIDEFIFTMTHDKVVDWLLPGVPPSGKKLSIPMMSVVNVRGDRLYHEHIWWDQATVLLQAGVVPTHLPYPFPDGKGMLRLPVAGVETAKLLADETAGGSNIMLEGGWGVRGS